MGINHRKTISLEKHRACTLFCIKFKRGTIFCFFYGINSIKDIFWLWKTLSTWNYFIHLILINIFHWIPEIKGESLIIPERPILNEIRMNIYFSETIANQMVNRYRSNSNEIEERKFQWKYVFTRRLKMEMISACVISASTNEALTRIGGAILSESYSSTVYYGKIFNWTCGCAFNVGAEKKYIH